jgi:tubulin polyglutamylase TTLL6/13
MCFEILGFDIFLDSDLKPWVIEVNHTPSFSTDSPLDFKIKKGVILHTMRLLNLNYQRKAKYKKEKQEEFQNRAIRGKVNLSKEMKELLRKKRDLNRNKVESKIETDYELIFPSPHFNYEKYKHLFEAALQNHKEFNSVTAKKVEDDEPKSTQPKPFLPSNGRVVVGPEKSIPSS